MPSKRIVVIGSAFQFRILRDLLDDDPRLIHVRDENHLRGYDIESVLVLAVRDGRNTDRLIDAARERQKLSIR